MINSKELKKLYVTYKSLNYGYEHLEYGGEIIEGIGDNSYLFNLRSLSGNVCDGNYSNGLRCYQDSDLGLYSTGIADSCDYTYVWTGIESRSLNTVFKIYPNPTSDWIDIKSNINKELEVIILDLSGKVLIKSKILGSSKVDLTNLQKGIYILKIKELDKILETKKIIIR